MKSGKFDITPVVQIFDCGCVLACIAMIRGIDQKVLDKEFRTDFSRKGVGSEQIVRHLGDYGYVIAVKYLEHYRHPKDGRKFLLEPFADVHILCIKQFSEVTETHAVIMLKNGKIIDPAGRLTDLDQIYHIIWSIGVWK